MGNILDNLGRTIEAIDQYLDCIELYPKHAVAMANCGIAIKRILWTSESHATKNVYAAWQLLSSACKLRKEVLTLAGGAALEHFDAHLDDLAEKINHQIDGGVDALQDWSIHRKEVHGHPEAPSWLGAINRDRLLLTLNQIPFQWVNLFEDDGLERLISGLRRIVAGKPLH